LNTEAHPTAAEVQRAERGFVGGGIRGALKRSAPVRYATLAIIDWHGSELLSTATVDVRPAPTTRSLGTAAAAVQAVITTEAQRVGQIINGLVYPMPFGQSDTVRHFERRVEEITSRRGP